MRTHAHPLKGVRTILCVRQGWFPVKAERPENPLANVLGPLDGASVPGGCESCNAHQVVRSEASGMWVIDVLHDDGCPVLFQDEDDGPPDSRTQADDEDEAASISNKEPF